MLRAPLTRAIALATPSRAAPLVAIRSSSNAPAKAPEKIEVFVDDQPVMVLPGTTVLQVNRFISTYQAMLNI